MRVARSSFNHSSIFLLFTYQNKRSAMKFFICALALVASAFAAPQGYSGAVPTNVRTNEAAARIVSLDSDILPDGAYKWALETENGIQASETNVPKPAGPNGEPAPNVQGGYRYTAPDGSLVEITYTAGEDGFVASGPAIPVAPPIPEEILKSLAWNAAHPEEDPENYKSVQPNPAYYAGRQ